MPRTYVPLLVLIACYVLYHARVAGFDSPDRLIVLLMAGYPVLMVVNIGCFLNRDRDYIQGLESAVATLLLFAPGSFVAHQDIWEFVNFLLSIVMGGGFTLFFLFQYLKKSLLS